MALVAGVGFSDHRHSRRAAEHALEAALRDGSMEAPDLVIAFFLPGNDRAAILDALTERCPDTEVVGCSAEGIVCLDEVSEASFGVTVAVLRGEGVRFDVVTARGLSEDSEAVGASIAAQLEHKIADDTRAMLTLYDGLTFNFDAFTRGLFGETSSFRPEIALFGAGAGDAWDFERTYQIGRGEITDDGVVCVLMSGDLHVDVSFSHGCEPLEQLHHITKCDGQLIYEIDGRPALDLILEYTGYPEDEWQKAIVHVAIGFESRDGIVEGYDDYLIRYFPAVDLETRSITISTEVEQGAPFRLMHRTPRRIHEANAQLAKRMRALQGAATPGLVLHFDCAGRGKVLMSNEEKREAIDVLRGGLSRDVPWIGMFSYGEMSPLRGEPNYHSYTAVLAVLR